LICDCEEKQDTRTVHLSHLSQIIVITGPTATGKTAVGIELAKLLDGEVVSADSMQVYKHMDIGTAKPSFDEMQGIPHHLIGIVEPWNTYSVARYIDDASQCVGDILRRNKVPILVGGTGLYIESLLSGREFSARGDSELRKALEAEYDLVGGNEMLERLREFDYFSSQKLYANDKKRIVRAFEVFKTTGKTISQHDFETKSLPPRYAASKIALTYADRAELYERIDRRVDVMISSGLEREVRTLFEMGVVPNATSMQAIGYKEMAQAISGEVTMGKAIDTIKMESRRYAKRQLSWLRRDDKTKWVKWDKHIDTLDCAQRLAEDYEKK